MPFIPLKKPGLTATELLRSTPKVTHQRADGVRLFNVKEATDPEGHKMFVARTQTVRDLEGAPVRGSAIYSSSVRLIKPEYRYVKVDCTCKFHPFQGAEVSLHLRNAADIIRSNGRAPRIRNPGMEVKVCKHLVVLLRFLQNTGKIK